jgi:hypothetical protein
MTDDRSLERAARSWLETGPTEAPDRAVEAALLRIEITRQERDWPVPWRLPKMTTPTRVAVVAVIGVLAVGAVFLVLRPDQPSVAGPSSAPTPSPSPQALHVGALAAGTYGTTLSLSEDGGPCLRPSAATSSPVPTTGPCSAPGDSTRITLTVPDGWERLEDPVLVPTAVGFDAPDGAAILIGRLGPGAGLLTDPCHPVFPPGIAVGPSVDEFADALAEHPLLDVSTPIAVTLGGHPGKYVELQVPSDISTCPDNYWPWDPGIFAQGPNNRWHIWILDVEGVRVLVLAHDFPGTSTQDQAELMAIVESFHFEP